MSGEAQLLADAPFLNESELTSFLCLIELPESTRRQDVRQSDFLHGTFSFYQSIVAECALVVLHPCGEISLVASDL
jgi:hypothetical protein